MNRIITDYKASRTAFDMLSSDRAKYGCIPIATSFWYAQRAAPAVVAAIVVTQSEEEGEEEPVPRDLLLFDDDDDFDDDDNTGGGAPTPSSTSTNALWLEDDFGRRRADFVLCVSLALVPPFCNTHTDGETFRPTHTMITSSTHLPHTRATRAQEHPTQSDRSSTRNCSQARASARTQPHCSLQITEPRACIEFLHHTQSNTPPSIRRKSN